jgi:hypothetical protein
MYFANPVLSATCGKAEELMREEETSLSTAVVI